MSFLVEYLSVHRLRCATLFTISTCCRSLSVHLRIIASYTQPTRFCVPHLRQHQGPKDRTDTPHLSQICSNDSCEASASRLTHMQ